MKPKRQNKPSRKIYNFNKADSDNFKSMLREECDRFLQSNPELRLVDEKWDLFKECIQKGIDKFVPHHMSKGKQNHPWIDRDLIRYIDGRTLNWIQGFLSGREQCVVVNGSHSSWMPVRSGVPQGSVLGPTLFLIYINDIADEVNSTIRLFADDSILYREVKGTED